MTGEFQIPLHDTLWTKTMTENIKGKKLECCNHLM